MSNIVNKPSRERSGVIASIVGIVVNVAIFAVEFSIGVLSNSIAIIADSFHNLADGLTSIITMIGFVFAGKPADKEHPFGHGKSEYLSALFIAILILFVGAEFVGTSAKRILYPSPVTFNLWALILVLAFIPVKLALGAYYKKVGKKINSPALAANEKDVMNDVFVLIVASASLIASAFTKISIDGYAGMIVAFFIIRSGYSIAVKAVNSLLGEQASQELIDNIRNEIKGNTFVQGIHDLMIHNYGVGKHIASVHVVFPDDLSLKQVSNIVEAWEEDIRKKYSVEIAIHIDTVKTKS